MGVTGRGTQARLLKMEAPRCERKVFTRPPWPPQLPEIEEGCARSAPRRVQSFTVKAEFTHHAKQEFKRSTTVSDTNRAKKKSIPAY